MALTRDFKETVKNRAHRDPAFAKALLDEAATAFLNGEPDVARLLLRDLVNASLGFETLNKPSKGFTGCSRSEATRAWIIWRRSSARFGNP